MCANYHPDTAHDRLLQYFGVERPDAEPPPEMAFPLSIAPFIVRAPDRVKMERALHVGQFGLLPFWAKEVAERPGNPERPTASWCGRRGRRLSRPASRPTYRTAPAVGP